MQKHNRVLSFLCVPVGCNLDDTDTSLFSIAIFTCFARISGHKIKGFMMLIYSIPCVASYKLLIA